MTVRSRLHNDERGFTLIELVMAVTILGIIAIPLGNFMLAYFKNAATTQNRISDSHDVQIAAAYVSSDVANTGIHPSYTSATTSQSVWTTTFPASYCGRGTGTTVLLLSWNTWTVASGGGGSFDATTRSVAYAKVSGTLHRIYCASGTTVASDSTLVHGLQASSVQCSTSCESSTVPSVVKLTLNIAKDTTDQAATTVVLTGQRRQS